MANKFVVFAVIISAVLSTGYVYGLLRYEAGKRQTLLTIELARAKAVSEKEAIRHEVETLSTDDLLSRALKYVRD